MNTLTIIIKELQITFFAHQDEEHFFSWLESTPEVKSVIGKADGLHVTVETPISDDSLRSLIALLLRYRTDMKCLRIFLNNENADWFALKEEDEAGGWHRLIWED